MDNKKIATPERPEGEGSFDMLLRMNDGHKPLRDWAFSFIDWHPDMRILDAGCGGGAVIKEMLTLSEGSRIDGIDYSPDSVACAKEFNSKEIGTRVSVYEGDVSDLPFADNTYDLVTAVETVYFWPDIIKAMSEILRVLKPKGKAAILCEIDEPEKAKAWGDIHCNLKVYYPGELADIMKVAGFINTHFEVKENGYTLVTGEK